jgi:hypothetical protein
MQDRQIKAICNDDILTITADRDDKHYVIVLSDDDISVLEETKEILYGLTASEQKARTIRRKIMNVYQEKKDDKTVTATFTY